MKNTLIYGGMLFSIIGMLFFDDILVIKYAFLIGAIVLIVIGLGKNQKKPVKKDYDED